MFPDHSGGWGKAEQKLTSCAEKVSSAQCLPARQWVVHERTQDNHLCP